MPFGPNETLIRNENRRVGFVTWNNATLNDEEGAPPSDFWRVYLPWQLGLVTWNTTKLNDEAQFQILTCQILALVLHATVTEKRYRPVAVLEHQV
jgi:hypothetical protein